MVDDDITRLKEEYAARTKRLAGSDRYSLDNPAYLFAIQQRERQIIKLLGKAYLSNLHVKKVLEVGCGEGGVLLDLLKFCSIPNCLFGIDLLLDRLQIAKSRLLGSHFVNANGQNLPYRAQSFDLLLQFTALSSILNPTIREKMAAEMLRVLKADGGILWYDFWWNPTNAQTRGIQRREIKALFPQCRFKIKKITLAPPIARKIVPISWVGANLLESLKIFNSHYLVLIEKLA